MGTTGKDEPPLVTDTDVRRIEAGETVVVAGYSLTRDLVAAMTVRPYDYETDGRLKDVAVGVVADHLSRLVYRYRMGRPRG